MSFPQNPQCRILHAFLTSAQIFRVPMRPPLPAFLFPAVVVVVGGSRALFIALKVFGSEGEGAGSAPVCWGH